MFWAIDFQIVLHALYIELPGSVISLISMSTALRTSTTMCLVCTDVVFVQSRLAINNELSITLCGFAFFFCLVRV